MAYAQILSPVAALLAVALIATDRHIERALRDADATAAERAAPLRMRGPLARMRLNRFIGAGAIRTAGPSMFYIDPAGWRAWRRARRRRALTVAGLLLAGLAAARALGWIGG